MVEDFFQKKKSRITHSMIASVVRSQPALGPCAAVTLAGFLRGAQPLNMERVVPT